ncbi:TPA: hypothetical protein ACOVFI_001560 [Citrobacter braakii]
MEFQVHSYCIYTRQGILSLIEEFFHTSVSGDTVHIFDLIENPHPLLLLNKIKKHMYLTSENPQKVMAICNESTAEFLRRYNVICITPTEPLRKWLDVLTMTNENNKWSSNHIPELEQHYAEKLLTDKDIFILEHLCKGYSFTQIAELSGLNAKIVYARVSKIKYNFNLHRNNIPSAYSFILESRTNHSQQVMIVS